MRDGNSPTTDGPAETAEGPSGPVEGGLTPAAGWTEQGVPGSVHVIVEHGRTRVVLAGEVDADLTTDLAQALTDAGDADLPVDIDAQHVTFMDSSGIAFLARLAGRSAQPVTVLRASPSVRFLLEVTRIGALLAPEGDLASADTTPAPDDVA